MVPTEVEGISTFGAIFALFIDRFISCFSFLALGGDGQNLAGTPIIASNISFWI